MATPRREEPGASQLTLPVSVRTAFEDADGPPRMGVCSSLRSVNLQLVSLLPLLMGLLAIRNGKTYYWDDKTHTAKG